MLTKEHLLARSAALLQAVFDLVYTDQQHGVYHSVVAPKAPEDRKYQMVAVERAFVMLYNNNILNQDGILYNVGKEPALRKLQERKADMANDLLMVHAIQLLWEDELLDVLSFVVRKARRPVKILLLIHPRYDSFIVDKAVTHASSMGMVRVLPGNKIVDLSGRCC